MSAKNHKEKKWGGIQQGETIKEQDFQGLKDELRLYPLKVVSESKNQINTSP